MRRIGLAVVLGLTPLKPGAQQAVKVPMLGLLSDGFPPSEAVRQRSPFSVQFLAQLRELGWHEGKTIAIERRYAEGNLERLPALALLSWYVCT